MSSILIVDDEPQLRHALALNLGIRGYDIHQATDGEAGIQAAATTRPDLILLDLGLPHLDGMNVLESVRRWSDVPVVVLTARDDEQMKIRALDAGADDYVTKPFGMNELLARLRAVLRRATTFNETEPRLHGEWFDLDLADRQATAGEPRRAVHLTRIEWAIIEQLARNPGRLITYQQLIDNVWGTGSDVQPRLIRVHLNGIRRKLERDPARPRHFLTDSGVGLRYVAEEDDDHPIP
jgi:two-component system KDP operon response regulator KdpE